jgi:hypothetical protein
MATAAWIALAALAHLDLHLLVRDDVHLWWPLR